MEALAHFENITHIISPIYDRIELLVYGKLLLPAFLLALVFIYFRTTWGSPDFFDAIKRLVIAALLIVAFPEIVKVIISISGFISETISPDSADFFKEFFSKGVESSKESLNKGSLLNFPNLIIGGLSFLCWCVSYVASYFIIAMRQFMWAVLCALAPLLILCHIFPSTSNITKGLFKSLIELSCWEIYWRILEQILHTLGYVELTGVGDWFITMVLNLIVAFSMIQTPAVVRSILGGSLTSISGALKASIAWGAITGAVGGAAALGIKALSGVAKGKDIMISASSSIKNAVAPRFTKDALTGGKSIQHTKAGRFASRLGAGTPPKERNPNR
ncbi:MAG: type IV secretion system protein [Deltaproteobacteria bacterium]|nr:type IV secretion system protein [Deltaproteobacteria bacterium]